MPTLTESSTLIGAIWRLCIFINWIRGFGNSCPGTDFEVISSYSVSGLSQLTHFVAMTAGICGLYERKLKDLNPSSRNINYDISDLYNFIDGLADMSALVYLSLSISPPFLVVCACLPICSRFVCKCICTRVCYS